MNWTQGKKSVRIVKRFNVGSEIPIFVIQTKHWLFFWIWIDGKDDSPTFHSFSTLDEAKKNIYHFDGSKSKDIQVYPEDMVIG